MWLIDFNNRKGETSVGMETSMMTCGHGARPHSNVSTLNIM